MIAYIMNTWLNLSYRIIILLLNFIINNNYYSCVYMQISMNVILGMMGVTTNATTRWEASTVHVTPALIWILMEGSASLIAVCCL